MGSSSDLFKLDRRTGRLRPHSDLSRLLLSVFLGIRVLARAPATTRSNSLSCGTNSNAELTSIQPFRFLSLRDRGIISWKEALLWTNRQRNSHSFCVINVLLL